MNGRYVTESSNTMVEVQKLQVKPLRLYTNEYTSATKETVKVGDILLAHLENVVNDVIILSCNDIRGEMNIDDYSSIDRDKTLKSIFFFRNRRILVRVSRIEDGKIYFERKTIERVTTEKLNMMIGTNINVMVETIIGLGVIVDLGNGVTTLLPSIDFSVSRYDDLRSVCKIGQILKVQLKGWDEEKKRFVVSRKDAYSKINEDILPTNTFIVVTCSNSTASLNKGIYVEYNPGNSGIMDLPARYIRFKEGDKIIVHLTKHTEKGFRCNFYAKVNSYKHIRLNAESSMVFPMRFFDYETVTYEDAQAGDVYIADIEQARVNSEEIILRVGEAQGIMKFSDFDFAYGDGTATTEKSIIAKVGNRIKARVIGKKDGVLIMERKSVIKETLEYLKGYVGDTIESTVETITPVGVFVDIGNGVPAYVPWSEWSKTRYYGNCGRFVTVGEVIKVKILDYNEEKMRFVCSRKQTYDFMTVQEGDLISLMVAAPVPNAKVDGVFVEYDPRNVGIMDVPEDMTLDDFEFGAKVLARVQEYTGEGFIAKFVRFLT